MARGLLVREVDECEGRTGEHAPQYRKPSVFFQPAVNATPNKRRVTARFQTTSHVPVCSIDRVKFLATHTRTHWRRARREEESDKLIDCRLAATESISADDIQKTTRALIKSQ